LIFSLWQAIVTGTAIVITRNSNSFIAGSDIRMNEQFLILNVAVIGNAKKAQSIVGTRGDGHFGEKFTEIHHSQKTLLNNINFVINCKECQPKSSPPPTTSMHNSVNYNSLSLDLNETQEINYTANTHLSRLNPSHL
jgi:hypothetical protein